jgi:pilus assembly protein CpaB
MFANVNKSWIILVGALIFGGLAVFASSRYISQTISAERARLNPNVAMIDVVVAKESIERGTNVGSENMAVRQVPAEYVPGTAVTPEQFANIEGARLAVDMRPGEILLRGTLEGADSATFATKVREGVRAMTVAVDEVNSLNGLLQPGDRIDLFFTARPPANSLNGQRQPERTALLMQNVLLLATGRQVRPAVGDAAQPGVSRTYNTVTLEASPVDAQRLILAQKAGSLTAVLRGPTDKSPLLAATMDSRDLFGARPAGVARRSGPRAEVIVGGRGGGRLERDMIALAPYLAPGAVPVPQGMQQGAGRISTPPAAALDKDAAQAVSQLLDAARATPMDLH